jgi:aerobic carbon-monoxide dehydrogenase medium subunit
VKPAPFDYFAPSSLDEALALLEQHGGDAKPLAGGQSLIPAMNFRLATPAVLVDLNGVAELAYVRKSDNALHIGGMTRHRTLETNTVVAADQPLIADTMPFVAHQAIRTRGTIGGSLAHADPAAELPAVMLALQATMTLRKKGGTRQVPASEFFTGLFSTAIEPGEIITEVSIPRADHAHTACAFDEISRRHGDFALAGAAAVVSVDNIGVCTDARVALLSVADSPVIAGSVSSALGGQRPTPRLIRDAAEASAASSDIDPASDIHASSRYRRRLAAVLIRRVLERAFHALESA